MPIQANFVCSWVACIKNVASKNNFNKTYHLNYCDINVNRGHCVFLIGAIPIIRCSRGTAAEMVAVVRNFF